MPGMGQWDIITKEKVFDPGAAKEPDDAPSYFNRNMSDELAKPECWQCGKHAYTLVFWSKSIWQHVSQQSIDNQREFAHEYGKYLLDLSEFKRYKHYTEPDIDSILSPAHVNEANQGKRVPSPIYKNLRIISEQTMIEKTGSSIEIDLGKGEESHVKVLDNPVKSTQLNQ